MASYTTTDLYFAAALKVALNLPPPFIRASGRLSTFVFDVDPSQAQHVAGEFYGDALLVPARRYASDLRDLKGLVCQLRGAPR